MDFGVTVFDPERKQLVLVPTAQAEYLRQAGYSVGPDAQARADEDGWHGTALAFANGVVTGGTAGLSDLAIPESAHRMIKAAQDAHPVAAMAGKLAGVGGMVAATAGLGPIVAGATRVIHGAISGGMQEVSRAKMNNEPIQWERVRSGLTLGGIFGAVAEGIPIAIPAAARLATKGVAEVAKRWPQEAGHFASEAELPAFTKLSEMGESIRPPSLPSSPRRALAELSDKEFAEAKGLPIFEEAAKQVPDVTTYVPGKFKTKLGDITTNKALFTAVMPSSVKATLAGALAADRIITRSLNRLRIVNGAIEGMTIEPAGVLMKTIKALTTGGGEALTPKAMPDVDKDYARKAAMVNHVMESPEGFAENFSNVFGPILRDHLPLHQGLLTNTLNAFGVLQGALPKDPYDPTIAGSEFEPTRKQKKDFLDHFDAVDNFAEAMKRPTPAKILMAEQANPEQLNLLRQTLIGHLQNKGSAKLPPFQRRSISIILGMPITPELQPQYIQRLQATSVPPSPQAPGGSKQMTPKIANNVTMRDMPDNMRLQMGI